MTRLFGYPVTLTIHMENVDAQLDDFFIPDPDGEDGFLPVFNYGAVHKAITNAQEKGYE